MIKTYTMKLFRIIQLLLAPAVLTLLLVRCDEGEDKLTGSNPEGNAYDASSRITGFDSELTGAEDTLQVLGSDLQSVTHVLMGDRVVPVFDVSSTSFRFVVPNTVFIGEQEVMVIFSDGARAQAFIEVVPLPIITVFNPVAGAAGAEITIQGDNLNYATAIKIGTLEATITAKTKETATFTVPAGATSSKITVETEAGNAVSTMNFIACEVEPSNVYCLPSLNANNNGGFENGTLGVVGSGGDHGGNWFLAGSGTRATYEIIDAPLDDSPSPGLGTKTLKATITALSANNWDIQVVNDGFTVPAGKRFVYMARVWADQAGRIMRLAGGVSQPSYQDMRNSTNFTLQAGWNNLSINTQHAPGQQETQIRLQANFSFPENEGAVFYFDDFRVVETGDQVNCATDPDLYFQLYNVTTCP